MTIALPSVGYLLSRPQLVDSVSASRVGARIISFVEYADPFWKIDMRTRPLKAKDVLLVEAFRDQTRTGRKTVVYTPTHACVPQAYWGNGGASALMNAGVVTAITDGFIVAFNSVDDGLVLMTGDLIGLEKDDYRSLHRVVTGGTASANALSVVVEPFVPAYITTGAVVRFKDPQLNCRVLPGSFSVPAAHLPVASFTLVEVPK